MGRKRKSPKQHTVHTKHPRYNVNQYPRGKFVVVPKKGHITYSNQPFMDGNYLVVEKLDKGHPAYPQKKTRVMILGLLHEKQEPLKDYQIIQHLDYWASRWDNDELHYYAIMQGGIKRELRDMAERGLIHKRDAGRGDYHLTKKGKEVAEIAYQINQGLI